MEKSTNFSFIFRDHATCRFVSFLHHFFAPVIPGDKNCLEKAIDVESSLRVFCHSPMILSCWDQIVSISGIVFCFHHFVLSQCFEALKAYSRSWRQKMQTIRNALVKQALNISEQKRPSQQQKKAKERKTTQRKLEKASSVHKYSRQGICGNAQCAVTIFNMPLPNTSRI